MNGYQITLFTQQNRRIHGKPLGEWLLQLARDLELPGATLKAAAEGLGRSGKLHSAHFFELADQPIEVTLIVSTEQADRLMARLAADKLNLFYVKVPVEFGTVGA